MDTFKVRPIGDFLLLGTDIRLDHTKWYDAVNASNTPDWKKRNAIYVLENEGNPDDSIGFLLEGGDYEMAPRKPLFEEIEGLTVREIMERFFPHVRTYDTALPQQWVDACEARGLRVLGRCVWSYDSNLIFGEPLFFTELSENIYKELCGNAMSSV